MIKKIYTLILAVVIISVFSACQNQNLIESTNSTEFDIDDAEIISEQGGLLPKLELEILLEESDMILTGIVKGISPGVETTDLDSKRPLIHTDIIVEVTQVFKGPDVSKIGIRRIGGITDIKGKKFALVTESPHYKEGEEVLLFLKRDPKANIIPDGISSRNYFRTVAHGKWERNNDSFMPYTSSDLSLTLDELEKITTNKQD